MALIIGAVFIISGLVPATTSIGFTVISHFG
jgi:hypothetical protein